MNLFFGPKLVLVLNNINSHFSENLITIYKETKIYLEYLPLYLFGYNLIEEFFSALKL